MEKKAAGRVSSLFRYPIKGLSPDPLEEVAVEPGETFPGDRAFALENGPSGFDPDAPEYRPKAAFFMLMSNAVLARFHARVDRDTGQLTIFRDGELLLSANLETRDGRRTIEAFFNAALGAEARGPVRLLRAPGHSFSDVDAKVVHIVNLASLRELETALERPVDPTRFRANIVIDGADPWAERGWVGARLEMGALEMEVVKETERCAAPNVNPANAERDMTLTADLNRLYGHCNFGIYAKVTRGGSVGIGAPVTIVEG